MISSYKFRKKPEMQSKQRSNQQLFARIRELDKQGDCDFEGFTMDVSDSGISLITYRSLPIGSRVAINMDGNFTATGEVVNLKRLKWPIMTRLGVRFIEHNKTILHA